MSFRAPEKPFISQKWDRRQRYYFRRRMENKYRQKIGIDKRAVA